jgi:hypothetical protein
VGPAQAFWTAVLAVPRGPFQSRPRLHTKQVTSHVFEANQIPAFSEVHRQRAYSHRRLGGGRRAGGAEGLVLGLDEAGTLWTGKLGGSGGTWSVQWTEVADQARTEREAALKDQATRVADHNVEADKRRP